VQQVVQEQLGLWEKLVRLDLELQEQLGQLEQLVPWEKREQLDQLVPWEKQEQLGLQVLLDFQQIQEQLVILE